MLDALGDLIAERPDAPFVLAVSGGRDSVVLLDCFAARFPASRLTVAHFDHRARPDSADDHAFVESLAAKYGIVCLVGRSARAGARSEGELRDERLAFLESVDDTAWIVTAHHATDQLETFLLRVLRGTGLAGLSGIPPRRGRFVRPFLGLSREALARFAEVNRLTYREDPSNRLPEYARNRVRNEILPLMDGMGHGGIESVAERIAALCGEIRQTTEAYRGALARSFERVPEGVRISARTFHALPREDRAALVKLMAPSDGASRPRVLALVDDLARGRRGGELAGGVRVRRSKGFLYFSVS